MGQAEATGDDKLVHNDGVWHVDSVGASGLGSQVWKKG